MKISLILLLISINSYSIERKDNIYVKGYYGYGYNDQRYSHIDYIKNYYGEEDDELETQTEEYCDALFDDCSDE